MNKRIEEHLVLKKGIKKFINKVLVLIIIFLITLIIIKEDSSLKSKIEEEIYSKSFKFTKVRTIYEKYFGNILSLENETTDTSQVFNEKLIYTRANSYKDGVKLSVSDNYLVPVLESGIIIYVGEKDGLNTIIVERVDGIETYYGNINIGNYKLYDYVEQGQTLGETISNELYLYFIKDGEKLDYKNYI